MTTSTFVFADLAGFTALTETHGDEEAIQIASEFTARVRRILPSFGAEEVKTIGDEVMIRVHEPVNAVRLGMRIADELAFHGSPPVRVGMHSGSALARDGDWFGATVNLASRVTRAAKPGEVLLTEQTRRQLGGGAGIELEERGEHYFKNVSEPTFVYRALSPGHESKRLEVDPVCRMAVDPARAARTERRRGIPYFFCSDECRRLFDQEPRRYVAMSPGARAARRGFLINLATFAIIGGVHLVAWVAGGMGGESPPPMLFLFVAWAIVLVFHYRSVREVL
jgi:YHS domain-containing protein